MTALYLLLAAAAGAVLPVQAGVTYYILIDGVNGVTGRLQLNYSLVTTSILKPLGMGLDNSALEAVKRWKFQPGTLHGQPVPVIYNLTVNFRLQ